MSYALARLVTALLTILGTISLVFVLVRVLPGDPAVVLMGDYASSASPAQLQQVRERLGLDKTMPEQFVRYVASVAQGDLEGQRQAAAHPGLAQAGFVA